MGCAEGFVRITMFLFNFLIWLAGAAILIVGIIVAVNNPFKDYFTITVNVSEAYWIVVLVIIFTTAGILVAIGFLGCCGACKEHSCMLKTYAIVLLIMILVEVVGIILIAVFHNKIQEDLQNNMGNQITVTYYNETSNDALSLAWNKMMIDLKCCGVSNYSDWAASSFYRRTGQIVPVTCCNWDGTNNRPVDASTCLREAQFGPANGSFSQLHAQGCFTQIENILWANKVIVIAILAAVAGAMLLGIFAACCLAKSYSGSDAYA